MESTLIVLTKSRLGPFDVSVHRNMQWYHSHPGSPIFWFHSTSNQLVLSVPVNCLHIGFFVQWHLGMLMLKHYIDNVFQGIWVHEYFPYLIERLSWCSTSGFFLAVAACE